MGKLGRKFNHKIRNVGKKFDSGVHKLGQKTNNVLDKIEKVNTQVINKSGKGLRIADRILKTADGVVQVLNDAGISKVPILGDATGLVGAGLHDASRGVHKANKLREKYKTASGNVLNKAREGTAQLEKMNSRKIAANLARDDSEDGFN